MGNTKGRPGKRPVIYRKPCTGGCGEIVESKTITYKFTGLCSKCYMAVRRGRKPKKDRRILSKTDNPKPWKHPDDKPGPRRCLKCKGFFPSTGFADRICESCEIENAQKQIGVAACALPPSADRKS